MLVLFIRGGSQFRARASGEAHFLLRMGARLQMGGTDQRTGTTPSLRSQQDSNRSCVAKIATVTSWWLYQIIEQLDCMWTAEFQKKRPVWTNFAKLRSAME